MPTVHLIIKGKVQGVFFRATAKEKANEYGILGWIKNTKDNNVEATITANADKLNKFINWCKTGPQKSSVSEVIVSPVTEIVFEKFEIVR